MTKSFWIKRGWTLGWATLVLVSYVVRTPVPIDETRYLSVAWDMWQRGDFLVPYLNGAAYSHKPPLMFWLFQLGWAVFGVDSWWPRLVPPLFVLAAMYLTVRLARRLWPERPEAAIYAPWVLAGSFYWAFYTSATMFDMILAAFVLLALYGIWAAHEGRRAWAAWLLVGVACGLGILTKGPVMLLHIAFAALLGPWWSMQARRHAWRWYAGVLLSVTVGVAIALSWALAAGHRGGPAYEEAILWHQTAGRVAQSFAHRRNFFWYLPLLPIMLFPWLMWPPLYRALVRLRGDVDAGTRFCIAWAVPTLLVFFLISGKQPHYLLPLFPAFALLSARALGRETHVGARWAQLLPALFLICGGLVMLSMPLMRLNALPGWVDEIYPLWGVLLAALGALVWMRPWTRVVDAVVPLAVISIAATVVFVAGIFQAARPAYDVTPAARYLSKLQQRGITIAHVGTYNGQFQFFGRLRHPILQINDGQLEQWARRNPNGRVILYSTDPPPSTGPRPEFLQRYKSDWLAIWSAKILCAMPACSPGGFLRQGAALPDSLRQDPFSEP